MINHVRNELLNRGNGYLQVVASHPGDNAANAIFSQAAMAIRSQAKLLLGSCTPPVRAVLVTGQSQSSMMLAGYVNIAQPTDRIYDGFVLHSGFEPVNNNPAAPTFVIFTMTEGNGQLTDGPNLVKWVVAGATHSDTTLTTVGMESGADVGVTAPAECTYPGNTFPSYRVFNAAFDWLNRWVRKGERPPSGTPLVQDSTSTSPFGMFGMLGGGSTFQKDDYGNVLGGVRLPEIEVPTAMYSTSNSAKSATDIMSGMACGFAGAATPFTAEQLQTLYPTHGDYVRKYTSAADKALADGYLLQADYEEGIEQAQNAPIPN